MKIIETYKQEHQCDVVLWQHRDGRFMVKYGHEIKAHLSYEKAAEELGCCLMHQLTCAGRVDQ